MFVGGINEKSVACLGAPDSEHIVFVRPDDNLVHFDASPFPVKSHMSSLRPCVLSHRDDQFPVLIRCRVTNAKGL